MSEKKYAYTTDVDGEWRGPVDCQEAMRRAREMAEECCTAAKPLISEALYPDPGHYAVEVVPIWEILDAMSDILAEDDWNAWQIRDATLHSIFEYRSSNAREKAEGELRALLTAWARKHLIVSEESFTARMDIDQETRRFARHE